MKLIKKVTGIDEDNQEMNNPDVRIAVRGIVLDDKNRLALLHRTSKNDYKLVGGGVDEGESHEQAFKREVLEESGCEVEIIKELGYVEEHRKRENYKHISYTYIAKVVHDTGFPNFTQKEIEQGCNTCWFSVDEALNRVKNTNNINGVVDNSIREYNSYNARFVTERETAIIEEYIKEIGK